MDVVPPFLVMSFDALKTGARTLDEVAADLGRSATTAAAIEISPEDAGHPDVARYLHSFVSDAGGALRARSADVTGLAEQVRSAADTLREQDRSNASVHRGVSRSPFWGAP
jgi:hypothetical protein